jgi:ClpP class serine protease
MKQFPNIISKLFYEPLMITPQKHAAICQVVERHMATGKPKASFDDEHGTGTADDDRPDELDYQQFGAVAVIPVHGVIEKHMVQMASAAPGCDLDTLCAMIDVAEMDPTVEKLLFDFRTPGGSVIGVPEAARKILRCSKETVGFFDDECCSGGVYLASQCQRLYGTASGMFGSIGVWSAYMDVSRQMAMQGETIQAFSAGKFKLMGAYWKTLTPEESGIIQARIDKLWAGFKTAVCAVRSCTDDAMGNGLVFDGEEAAARGLTDGVVESIDDILRDMVE